jgi:hypothetical protein
METIERPVYSIERVPRWVRRNNFDLEDRSKHSDYPHFFLLLDYQKQFNDQEVRAYYRSVQKINDLSQIEDASLFLRELRAGNEKMIYHRIDILRDGHKLSALNPENIRVYQRERSLKKHVTSERMTVCHSIDDLRVGDLIDLQATLVQRANEHPVVVKHDLTRYWLRWQCLVLRQNIRIINRSSRSLSLQHHFIENGQEFDSHVVLKPKQECERHYSRLTPQSISSTAPDWLYTDFLQITPVTCWAQISRDMHRIYVDAAATDCDLDCSEIDRIKLTGNKQVDALRIIRFVQNEIRYLSENDGIYSHTPRAPRYILRRGAGDCKGKSNLLVLLLKSIGVDANTALVNSGSGKAIVNFKPSACHFDHVVVRVATGDRHYYFDPTLQHQAGDFEHAAQLEYGYALNLTDAGEDLCELPWDLSRRLLEITHRFNLREARHGNGSVTITRSYYTMQADTIRAYLAASTKREAQDSYFRRAEDDIAVQLAVITPLQIVSDDIDRNLLVTRELYRIVDMEGICDGDEVRVTTNFHLGFPYPDDDRFALQISAEGVLEHNIEVLYPDNIDLQPSTRIISNAHFEYRRETSPESAMLNFRIRVAPSSGVVGHDDITQYHEDARRLYLDRYSRFRFQEKEEIDFPWESIAALLLLLAMIATVLVLMK